MTAIDRLPGGSTVLDPMCGSGTVLIHAIEAGHNAIGFDMDPLSVLLSKVSCSPLRADKLLVSGLKLVEDAVALPRVDLPWIDDDLDTKNFVNFWFAEGQRDQLRRLAFILNLKSGKTSNALRVALSRTIVTKDRGASLARDVSHSRPHRDRVVNDFDVYDEFLRAVKRVGEVIDRRTSGTAVVYRRDARKMPHRMRGSVDLVVTSPPYLNAIDYMRGHRLSLVWLGYSVGQLRDIRAKSVGTQRQLLTRRDEIKELVPKHRNLSTQHQGMLDRYAFDMKVFMSEIAQCLKPNGEAVIVVGDSTIQGVSIRNSSIVEKSALKAGLRCSERLSRRLPDSSRYLPPPSRGSGAMSKRMRSEVVFRFERD